MNEASRKELDSIREEITKAIRELDYPGKNNAPSTLGDILLILRLMKKITTILLEDRD